MSQLLSMSPETVEDVWDRFQRLLQSLEIVPDIHLPSYNLVGLQKLESHNSPFVLKKLCHYIRVTGKLVSLENTNGDLNVRIKLVEFPPAN
ncbi:unnamed protein product [Sphenostylis stenocarpa]|uniref:Uncharacterized protein n=1 Tax=Sphenostylis stenocarpa TaxID=92480 RepID=A0AA86T7A1_9FABA|nr:unnamed protein product [Sphenostylis stenocarpa]